MPDIRYFTSDPGNEVLLNEGAVVNVILKQQVRIAFTEGPGTIGLVGQVAVDHGLQQPVFLQDNTNSIYSVFGGFDPTVGDGVASGYDGNLAAHVRGLTSPQAVLIPVPMWLREAGGADARVTVTLGSALTEQLILPAGTVFREPGGATVATLKELVIPADTIVASSWNLRVRFKQGTFVADLSTYVEILNDPSAGDVTVTAGGIAVEIDATELIARYQEAIDTIPTNEAGLSVDILVADHSDPNIGDSIASYCAAALTNHGHLCMAVVAPSVGTSAADAQGVIGEGAGRPGLAKEQTSYTHPSVKRQFLLDDSIPDPSRIVTMPGQVPWGFRISNEPPENNPARPSPVLVNGKLKGIEALSPIPNRVQHFKAGISQPELARTNGGLTPSYRDGIMINGDQISTVRMRFFIAQNIVANLVQLHKAPATKDNQEAIETVVISVMGSLQDAQRIGEFGVSFTYNPATMEFTIDLTAQERGNLNIITLRFGFGPSGITIS